VGSGLFVRSLSRVQSVDVGIDLDRVLIATMNLDRAGFDSTRQRLLLQTAIERLQHVPSVAAATAVGASTPTRVGNFIQVVVPGTDTGRAPPNGGPIFSVIDNGFLRVVGARLRRGRVFTPAETRTRSRVAIVNQTAADFYWPGEDPLGKCMIVGRDNACTEVVGVIQPVMLFRIVNEPRYAQLFIPSTHPSAGNRPLTLLIRSAGDPRIAAVESRRVLQQLAPNMPLVSVRSIADLVAPQLRPWRLGATMFSVFGCVALAIAAIGLYSVMAYWVTQRRHEFGVRMALGARRGDIWRLVAAEAARTIGVGLLLGLAVAALAAPRVADLLYRTSPRDGTVYGVVASLLTLAALLATVIPTHRSTQVNSATALRAE
jgi:predicted permease